MSDAGPRHGRLRVDSLRDMLANKLSAIVERTEGKDFADLCFLLRHPDLDLDSGMVDAPAKFSWPAIRYLLQAAFLRVDSLAAWPETAPPVTIAEARAFFRDRAPGLITLE